jgi:hypothetical protein
MTIKYTLTRFEIVRYFLRSLCLSPRLLAIVTILCLWPGVVSLSSHGILLRSVSIQDLIIACVWTLGVFLLLSLWIFVRGKTNERTLTTSEEGISTIIGSLNGQLPWSKIKTVKETADYVLIGGRNGNAFFIPERAFNRPEQKAQFLSEIRSWCNAK